MEQYHGARPSGPSMFRESDQRLLPGALQLLLAPQVGQTLSSKRSLPVHNAADNVGASALGVSFVTDIEGTHALETVSNYGGVAQASSRLTLTTQGLWYTGPYRESSGLKTVAPDISPMTMTGSSSPLLAYRDSSVVFLPNRSPFSLRDITVL